MRLYYHPLSGHAHRVHLFLSIIRADFELIEVDLIAGAQRAPDFLKINRFGQVPVLDDNGTIISDSNAILVYLAKKFGEQNWFPETALGSAHVQRWLSVAAGEIAAGPARARLIALFGANFNAADAIASAHRTLGLIDHELSSKQWIAALHPTIADLALYSFISSAPEGNVDVSGYLHICGWLKRVEAIQGFVPFMKSPVGLLARPQSDCAGNLA